MRLGVSLVSDLLDRSDVCVRQNALDSSGIKLLPTLLHKSVCIPRKTRFEIKRSSLKHPKCLCELADNICEPPPCVCVCMNKVCVKFTSRECLANILHTMMCV